MKKTIAAGLVVAALASAGQALALTSELTGFYRVSAIMGQLARGNDVDPDQLVSQRFRFKYTGGINDYVKFVYFGEVDMEWGDAGYQAARNQGGGVGGDGLNLETKNLYVETKFPGTPLIATIGLQGFLDSYDNNISGSDGAGLTFRIPTAKVDTEFGWLKFFEGDNNSNNTFNGSIKEDDGDWYFARVAVKPMQGLKIGGDLYYYKNQGTFNSSYMPLPVWATGQPSGADFGNTATGVTPYAMDADSPFKNVSATNKIKVNRSDLYYAGMNASYATPMFGIKGWFLYNWGKIKTTVMNGAVENDEDIKISGYSLSAKADVNFAGFNTFVRGTYWSKAGDDPEKSKAVFVPTQYSGEINPFMFDGIFMIMTGDPFNIDYPTGYVPAGMEAAYAGYGLGAIMVGGSYVPPSMKEFYVKGGVGYFRALTDEDGFYGERESKSIGTEAALRVGYKFSGGAFDLSLNGAYAWWGSFYGSTVSKTTGLPASNRVASANGDDPDNAYKLYLMANVPF